MNYFLTSSLFFLSIYRCFSRVKINKTLQSKDNRYIYSLVRYDLDEDGPFKVEDSGIMPGDAVFVTDEATNTVIAQGIFQEARSKNIAISLTCNLYSVLEKLKMDQTISDDGVIINNKINRNLDYRFRETANTTEINEDDKKRDEDDPLKRMLRIDKDEFGTSLGLARRNIIEFISTKVDGSKLRNLVLHNRQPTFQPHPPRYELMGVKEGKRKFNKDQLAAIDKVMTANHCALILGMPGTGKTTTIAALIDTLARLGKSVLLTSYTHSAVDNILLKMLDSEHKILRLGRMSTIHPEVQRFGISGQNQATSPEDISRIYFKPNIVAVTCLGVGHWLFSKRRFDYCIVDEASQATLPTCLGPILLADKFVLVGDHFQLSPLVKNIEALEGGLDISLFKYLNDKYPDAVINLEHQYRMCKEIMLLSNNLIYDGRLKCGSEEAANQSLKIPNPHAIDSWKTINVQGPEDDWLGWILKESNKVLYLNTDAIPNSMEINKEERIQNKMEAFLVQTIVEALCESGVPESALGVISVYRSQLKLINSLLKHRKLVEKLTADRFQGRDKDCVIITLVRSNQQNQIGELLQDWRRLNVAFTRAKSKLIIVGSRRTLESASALCAFLKLLDDNKWSYALPKFADEMYSCPALNSSDGHSQQMSFSEYLNSNYQMFGDDGKEKDAASDKSNKSAKTTTTSSERDITSSNQSKDSESKNNSLQTVKSSNSSTVGPISSSSSSTKQPFVSPLGYTGPARINTSTVGINRPSPRSINRHTASESAVYRSSGPVARDALAEMGIVGSSSRTSTTTKNLSPIVRSSTTSSTRINTSSTTRNNNIISHNNNNSSSNNRSIYTSHQNRNIYNNQRNSNNNNNNNNSGTKRN